MADQWQVFRKSFMVDRVDAPKAAAVNTELLWHTRDPLVVTVTFWPNKQSWAIGRDLLIGGFCDPTGDGDVRVSPLDESSNDLRLVLDAPSGHAEFRLDGDEVSSFLERTLAAVPLGAESYDLDAEARQLFGAES